MQAFNVTTTTVEDTLYEECGISMDTTRLMCAVAMHLGNCSVDYSGDSIHLYREAPNHGQNRFTLIIAAPGRA